MYNYKQNVLTKANNMDRIFHFTTAITEKEFNELKIIKDNYKEVPLKEGQTEQTFKGIALRKIKLFGKPKQDYDSALLKYLDESKITNISHNKDNYFTGDLFQWQRDEDEHFRHLIPFVSVKPNIFFAEIARFFDKEHIIIFEEVGKLKELKFEWCSTSALARKDYKIKY